MKLLDAPLSENEIRFFLDMLDGLVSRVCVTDDFEEIISSMGFAAEYLGMLAYSRVKALKAVQK